MRRRLFGCAATILLIVGPAPAVAAGVAPAMAAGMAAAPCGPEIRTSMPAVPWPLRRLAPERVWPLTRGAGVVVAVIDSGVSKDHPALAGQVLDSGTDLFTPGATNGTCDMDGHGTLVAGIIAGKVLPGSGFHGIAPDARILPIRVLEREGLVRDDSIPKRIATAITFAADSPEGVDVINMSLTTTTDDPDLRRAVQYAQGKQIVIVAAAGNRGGGQSQEEPRRFPAAYDGVIAVAGVDESGNYVDTSVPGEFVDIAAPGRGIQGPAPRGNGFTPPQEGTSFATPYVTGVVALVRALNPESTAAAIVTRVVRTADRPPGGFDQQVGNGVVNPYWAVNSISAQGGQPTVDPPRSVALDVVEPDPLGSVRAVAVWTALGAVVLSLLVLLGTAVVRRGRSRGWRPGLRPGRAAAPEPVPAPASRRNQPAVAQTGSVSVTAPAVRRAAGAGGRGAGAGGRGGTMPQVTMPTTSSGRQ